MTTYYKSYLYVIGIGSALIVLILIWVLGVCYRRWKNELLNLEI